MKLAQLQRVHPDYSADTLQTYRDLVAGGAQFQRHVARYLPRNDLEPTAIYKQRCARAHYVNYAAPITGYFAAWLFTQQLEVTFDGDAAWWPAWKEDCDGGGTDFDDFLRARFFDALVAGRTWWRVEPAAVGEHQGTSEPDSLGAWERAGLGAHRLCAVPAEAITHWARDASGTLAWVLEHERREDLLDLADAAATVTETWTQWRADGAHRRWRLAYPAGSRALDPQQSVPEVEAPPDVTGSIPLVDLSLPRHLWLLDLVAGPQLENFRARCALAWSIYRTCYAMPVFKLRDAKKPPAMGAGYYLMLGVDEAIEWPAPPSAPYQVIGEYAAALKDEIYRVTQQMAVGVDQGQAAAVGRSGDSKAADNRATEIVLGAFGAPVREAAERTADLLLRARGDAATRASARGMDRYHVTDAGAVLEHAAAAQVLGIPSRTHRVELLTRAAMASVPDVDEVKRAAIAREIEANTPAAVDAPPDAAVAAPPGAQATPSPPADAPAAGDAPTDPGPQDDARAPDEPPPRRHRLAG